MSAERREWLKRKKQLASRHLIENEQALRNLIERDPKTKERLGFLSHGFHELVNPLTVLLGSGRLMVNDEEVKFSPEEEELLSAKIWPKIKGVNKIIHLAFGRDDFEAAKDGREVYMNMFRLAWEYQPTIRRAWRLINKTLTDLNPDFKEEDKVPDTTSGLICFAFENIGELLGGIREDIESIRQPETSEYTNWIKGSANKIDKVMGEVLLTLEN